MVDIVVLLPAHNEEEAIGDLIDEIRSVDGSWRIVVVDSGPSVDSTAAIACARGVEVITSPKGKGRAVRQAFAQVSADYIAMLDADGSYHPGDIKNLWDQMAIYGADVVMGCRGNPQPGAMSPANRWGNGFITGVANLLFGTAIADLCTGMWLFRGEVVKSLDLVAGTNTLEADMFTRLVRGKYALTEMSIRYRPRKGVNKIRRWEHLKVLGFLIVRRLHLW